MILLTSDGLTTENLLNTVKEKVETFNYKKAVIVVTANKRFKKKADSWPLLIQQLEAFNLEVELFDFDDDKIEVLQDSDLIVLGGGNPFFLLLKMKQYKMESFLKEYVNSGKFIIGISGGSLVLQETLGLIDVFAPDMNMRHGGDIKGLGLTSVEILPHKTRYAEDFKNFKDRVKEYEDKHNIKAYLVEDTEGILINDEISIIR